ncbi:MAG: YdcH family protein [Pseudomonadota bacterium]
MSVSSHLSQLRQKHEALSIKIETEEKRPGRDELEITALKRQRLQVKDEITRLSTLTH